MEKNHTVSTFYTLPLLGIHQEAKDTYTFTFAKPDRFTWKEGACIHLGNSQFDIKKGKANKNFVRHLSIVSLADENIVTFTTRIAEDRTEFKEDLLRARPGDLFTLFKPENRLELRREGRAVILVSAGVGIAATRSMIRAFTLSQDLIPNLLHINIDSRGEYLYQKEIEQFELTTAGLSNIFVNSRQELYQKLEEKFLHDALYYLVGSDQFLLDVGRWLLSRQITQSSIILDKHTSFYDNYHETSFADGFPA